MNTLTHSFRSAMGMCALALGLTVAASQAQATVVLAPQMPDTVGIEQVSGGCGPGGHRDRFGHCRSNYRPAARACPPAYHPTPYGCRRNY